MGPSNTGARVLVLALDMADGGLIRHWSKAGRLPGFASLQSEGTWLDLESTAEVLHTSTWPTLATGTLPGRHGVYYPYQPRPGHQLAQHIDSGQYGVPYLWTLASEGGRRGLVYDVPETFPSAEFRGRGIFDWGTWAWYGEPVAQPPELLRQLKARFGAYPLGFEAKRLAFRLPDHLDERLLRAIRYKAATTRWLLDAADWELAVIGFCETHPAGHYLWPKSVPGPADDPAFEPLCRVYMAIDEAIGTVRAAVSSDVAVIVVSGDGVRPNRCGWHLLPQVLERLGYTASGSTSGNNGPPRSVVSRTHGLIPAAAKQLVTATLPWRVRDRLGVWLQTRGINWARTRAFALPTDLEGCIRINLEGREPFGIVEPGSAYAETCEEIRARLLELVNPATGRSAVREVWVRNEVFPGPCQENLPDLIVTWNDEVPISAVALPRIGIIEGINPDPRPGTHSTSGFALAAGPGITAGAEGRGRLVDIAPTVLKLLGIDSSSLDGHPLAALTDSRAEPKSKARGTAVRTDQHSEREGR